MGRISNAEKARRQAAAAEAQPGQSSELSQPPQLEEVNSPDRERNTHIELKDEARDSLMDEIIAKRGGEPKPEEPQPEAKPEPKPDEPKLSSEAKPEEPKAETPTEPIATEPAKLKQKVDGQEYEVTQAEIDEAGGERAWRIQRASENRLARANEALAEVNKARAEMAEWKKQQTPPTPVKSDQEFIKEKMDVIRFGSPEESAAAMVEVISRRNTDPNQIVVQATTNFKHEMALTKFRTDFQDVTTNPILSRLVQPMMQETLAPHIKNGTIDWSGLSQLDWNAEYAKIGNQIRGAIPRQSQSQSPSAAPNTPSSGLPDKEARKASIVNLPTGSARAELPKEEKPESRDDIVKAMKKERGIAVD